MSQTQNAMSDVPSCAGQAPSIDNRRATRNFWRYARWVLGAVVVAATVMVVVARYVIRHTPEIALARAVVAYNDHDLRSFRTYVNVEEILDDATDQMAAQISGMGGSNLGDVGTVILHTATRWLSNTVKHDYVPDLAAQAEEMVSSGNLPGQIRQNGNEQKATVASQLAQLLRAAASDEIKVQGFDASTVDDENARIPVRMTGANGPFTLQVRLHWVSDHWQVVAVEHIGALLSALY